MSAGTGVTHSEFNHEQDRETHFLQIWIIPARHGIAPGYEQKHFEAADKRGRLCLVASQDGIDGSVVIHQDARIFATLLNGTERVVHPMASGRRAYAHVARGAVTINGLELAAGDAMKMVDVAGVEMSQGRDAEVLLFDLA
jgi:redox-sensitive bicupin YhaK (pirin superfamily)